MSGEGRQAERSPVAGQGAGHCDLGVGGKRIPNLMIICLKTKSIKRIFVGKGEARESERQGTL